MRKVALLSDKDRGELFIATSALVGIRPEAVEKDFWVCYFGKFSSSQDNQERVLS